MTEWLAKMTALFKAQNPAPAPPDAGIAALAAHVGKDWVEGSYYDDAERALDSHWQVEVWDFIKDCDFSSFLDLPPVTAATPISWPRSAAGSFSLTSTNPTSNSAAAGSAMIPALPTSGIMGTT